MTNSLFAAVTCVSSKLLFARFRLIVRSCCVRAHSNWAAAVRLQGLCSLPSAKLHGDAACAMQTDSSWPRYYSTVDGRWGYTLVSARQPAAEADGDNLDDAPDLHAHLNRCNFRLCVAAVCVWRLQFRHLNSWLVQQSAGWGSAVPTRSSAITRRRQETRPHQTCAAGPLPLASGPAARPVQVVPEL